jgi:hypothetical protein
VAVDLEAEQGSAGGRAEPGGWLVEGAPAFLGSEVVVAGMSSTIQCQKPLPVGASGSYIETTKLWVWAGKPDHDSCGEMSLPPGTPKIPDSWARGSGCPLRTVVLAAAVRAENLCHQAIFVDDAICAVMPPDSEMIQVGEAADTLPHLARIAERVAQHREPDIDQRPADLAGNPPAHR